MPTDSSSAMPQTKTVPIEPSFTKSQDKDIAKIPSLYIFRAVLALGIIAYHLNWLPVGFGQAIMESFFALSGFLVTQSLIPSLSSELTLSRPEILHFWFRRVKRLGLALWVFVAISWFVCAIVPGKSVSSAGLLVGLTSPVFASNYMTIMALNASQSVVPFGALWSLAIEEQFYILLPLSILALFGLFSWLPRSSRRGQLVCFLLVVAASSFALRLIALNGSVPIKTEAYTIQYRMLGFALGSATYLGMNMLGPGILRFLKRWSLHLSVLFVIALLVISISVKEYTALTFVRQWTLSPVLTAALCATLVLSYGGIAKTTTKKSNRVVDFLVYLGKASYSIYLYHALIIAIIDHPGDPFSKRSLLCFIGSVIAGVLSYELVEKRLTSAVFRKKQHGNQKKDDI